MTRSDGWLLVLVGCVLLVGMGAGYVATRSAQEKVEAEAFERGRAKGYAEAMEWLMEPDAACTPKPQRFQKGDILIPMERL